MASAYGKLDTYQLSKNISFPRISPRVTCLAQILAFQTLHLHKILVFINLHFLMHLFLSSYLYITLRDHKHQLFKGLL
jgi:hypothetical protein